LVFDGTDTVMPFETSFFVHGADRECPIFCV
jgi:hypothetical protein